MLDDFTAALHGFTPASLRGVTLHTPGENTWKDIGGLNNVKNQLIRMLEWPTKVGSCSFTTLSHGCAPTLIHHHVTVYFHMHIPNDSGKITKKILERPIKSHTERVFLSYCSIDSYTHSALYDYNLVYCYMGHQELVKH